MPGSCRRCGARACPEVELERDGVIVASGHLCELCFAYACATADEHNQVFEAMITAGLSRDRANDLMIERLEGKGAKA